MASDIGGVEFLIQLNAKLDQATKMVKVLTQTEAAVAKADAALKKAEKSTSLLSRAMGYAAKKTSGFLRDMLSHFTALAAFDFARGIVSGALALGKGLLMAAAGAEKTSRAFEFLFGKEQATRMEEAANLIAKHTQFDDDKIKASMQELAAAGLKPLQIIDAILVATDAAARMGDKGSFDGLISAVKQMHTMGRAPRGMHELGLARETIELLEKKIKGGTKALSAFFQAINQTGKAPVFDAALDRAKGLDVTFDKLKDLPNQFGQQLAKTEGYGKFKDAAAKLLLAFDPDSPNGKRIFTALESSFGKIAAVILKIDTQKIATALVEAFTALPGLVDAASKAVNLLVDIVRNLINAFAAFKGMATPEQKATVGGQVGGVLNTIGKWDQAIQRALGVKEDSLKGVVMSILTVGHVMERLGLTGGKSLAAGIDASKPAVQKSARAMAEVPAQTTAKVTEAHSPSRVFMRLGAQTAAGFALGIGGAVPDLHRSVAEAFSPPALMGGAGYGVAAGASLAQGRGGAGGGPHFEADITVNVGAVSGGEISARQLGEVSAAAIRRALEAWMVQMAAEGGAT
jgi:hypothetical protein